MFFICQVSETPSGHMSHDGSLFRWLFLLKITQAPVTQRVLKIFQTIFDSFYGIWYAFLMFALEAMSPMVYFLKLCVSQLFLRYMNQ